MRPERTTSISMSSWRSTNQLLRRQISSLTIFQAMFIFSLLTGLALSFTLNSSLATAV
jgi:hypothetical protein